MFPYRWLRYRRPAIVALHALLIPLGMLTAFALRFEFDIPPLQWDRLVATLPYLVAARLLSFALFGLFSGWWRHVGMRDLLALLNATTLSSALFVAAIFLANELDGFSRSVLMLDWACAILLFGGLRFAVRWEREGRALRWRSRKGRPALIIGAGEGAERLLRQMQRDADPQILPIGLVDDDPGKLGMRLHGVRVLGTVDQVGWLVTRFEVELLVIAIPSASREEMRRIVDHCIATDIEFKIVPALQELLEGRARVEQLRNVQLEDLLGRDVIQLDLEDVKRDLQNRVVLITGAAGSIGSELVRQVAGCGPSRIVMVDQAESPLYFTHLDVQRAFPGLNAVPVVADVTDTGRLARVFSEHAPQYVFHAAAYKHVPLMESNVVEAVRNNVFGTLYVADLAARMGVKKFVLISTDKAVHPSSVMGATKRVAEQIVLSWPSLQNSGTDFRAVRFGNVLGSDGSVVPLFKRQMAAGGPVTVTHPDVTRYFMTIPEAVQLVLQAAAMPEAAGRISMLEMGDPIRILELAENLIRLSGLEPYRDVPITFTGLRPGEKLHEELMSSVEETVPTAVQKVRIVRTNGVEAALVEHGVDRLGAAVAIGDVSDLLAALHELVPDCVKPLSELGATSARMRGARD